MINPVGVSAYQYQTNLGHQGQLANSTAKSNGSEQRFVQASEAEKTLIGKFDEKTLKRLNVIPCQTCANRVYQDGSNDAGVSFKTPTHISPEMSGAMVASHEQEHVVRETAKAQNEGREVVSQSVRLYNGVCNECGKTYVAGGVTETKTASKQPKPTPDNAFLGNLVDMKL